MNKIKPFLKWAGNKYHCIERILEALPSSSKRLIEPFSGSGAVFINSNYPQYVLAETNADLVSLFQLLQQEGEPFIDYCAAFFSTETNRSDKYYHFREQFNRCEDKRLRSALFLYLNKHGYNGLCRYNKSGYFNVPFGLFNKPYFPRKEMLFFHQKSHSATFLLSDFRDTFSLAEPGDVIYCDPPYVPLTKSANFSTYTHKKFEEQDQIDLATLAMDTAARGITVIISNHDTAWTRQWYQHSKIVSFPVMRHISCNALQRRPVQELLAVFL